MKSDQTGVLRSLPVAPVLYPNGNQGRATVELVYHAGDPLAVRVVLNGEVWIVDRNSLVSGVTTPTGDGDVRFQPGIQDTMMILYPFQLNWRTMVCLDTIGLLAFLSETQQLMNEVEAAACVQLKVEAWLEGRGFEAH